MLHLEQGVDLLLKGEPAGGLLASCVSSLRRGVKPTCPSKNDGLAPARALSFSVAPLVRGNCRVASQVVRACPDLAPQMLVLLNFASRQFGVG